MNTQLLKYFFIVPLLLTNELFFGNIVFAATQQVNKTQSIPNPSA